MKSINYDEALTEYVISEFIKTNKRSPNELEFKLIKEAQEKIFPSLEQVGFSGHIVEKPQFASRSSKTVENKNREAIFRDVLLANRRVDYLTDSLENTFRGFHASLRGMKKKLDEIESRLDNVLLLTGNTDIFVYGIEENFVVQDKIDFERTTASVENGFCTLGRDGFGLVDLSKAKITYSTVTDKGFIGFQNTSDVEYLKTDDGTLWEHLVYTNYRTGRVSLFIDVDLDSPQFVSEVRFTANTGGTNSRVKATMFYSLDGKTFKSVSPEEKVLITEENLFNIGIDNIKKVRLLLSKDTFDNTTDINNQFVYTFSLDSLKLYSDGFVGNGSSIIYAGPYELFDEEGNAINYMKATCDLCVSQGEDTAVSIYLSNDGVNYKHADTTGDGGSIVTFGDSSSTGTSELLSLSVSSDKLVDDKVIDLQSTEALINTCLSMDWVDSLNRKSVSIKRNLPSFDSAGERINVYNTSSGWFYDQAKKLYTTTLLINNPLGLNLDLGNTSAFVNGVEVSGLITLKEGYTTFETSEANWQPIPKGLTTNSALRKSDSLYPYNHKYLVEGYVYSDTYQGEKVYTGVDEYFGKLLTYVPPELFAIPENTENLDIYTIDYSDGRGIFKVKADKSDGTWGDEIYSVNWLVSRGSNNKIWFKMVLNSAVGYATPVVTSLKIRVV